VNIREFRLQAQLDEATLAAWIDAGWLLPGRTDAGFSDVELARAQMIHDLRNDLGVNDEGVTVILDLLDQIHGVRRTFREFLSVVCAQPEATRRKIATGIRSAGEETDSQ
jgi:chaperone modulatory protein CbpM